VFLGRLDFYEKKNPDLKTLTVPLSESKHGYRFTGFMAPGSDGAPCFDTTGNLIGIKLIAQGSSNRHVVAKIQDVFDMMERNEADPEMIASLRSVNSAH
jgi:hypothetical protein